MLRSALAIPCLILTCMLGSLATASYAVPGTNAPGEILFEGSFAVEDLDWVPGPDGTVVPRLAGTRLLDDTGWPELPGRSFTLLVPVEAPVGGVEVVPLSTRTVIAPGPLALAAPRASSEGTTVSQAAHGEAEDGIFPAVWGLDGGTHMMRGFRLATVTVYPLRAHRDASGEWRELELLERFAVRWSPSPTASPRADTVVRLRRVPGERARAEQMLRSVVDNPAALAGYLRHDGAVVETPTKSFEPSKTPSLSGSAVSYLIITSEALADAFQPLAVHRTASGLPAVIETVEWIEANYRNGVDVQETIRMFIRDAYERWGVEYVLLGGDTDVLPARYALSSFYPTGGTTEIPADLYFACLDGNWNADGDMIFGEPVLSAFLPGDECDMANDIGLGRAPVSDVADVDVFVDKVIAYETADAGAGFGNRMLLAAEVLFYDAMGGVTTDGADFAEELLDTIVIPCSGMSAARMYESFDREDEHGQLLYPGSVQETAASVLDSLETGRYGIVNQIGHGFLFNMSMGTGSITVSDADALVNAPPFLMYALNCASAGFDYSCLMERFVQNPQGGSFASIGASRAAFASTANDFQQEFFRQLICEGEHRLGDLVALSRLPWLALSSANSFTRWTYLNYTMLGDPAQLIWTAAPVAVDVAAPASLATGPQTVNVTVTVGGAQVPGASVTLAEIGGAAYARGVTDEFGLVDLPIVLVQEGDLRLTVSGANLARDVRTIPVATSATYIVLTGTTIVDNGTQGSVGNGDGVIDAGETVALLAEFTDTGGGGAVGLSATLGTTSPDVTLLTATVPLGDVPPGGGGTVAQAPFLLRFAADLADGTHLAFSVDATDGGDVWPSDWSCTVLAPEWEPTALAWSDEVYGDDDGVVDDGERITFVVQLKNYGAGTADAVTGRLRTNSPNVTLHDTINTYADIGLLEETGGASQFSMAVIDASEPYDARLEFEDDRGRTHTHVFNFLRPTQPQDLTAGLCIGADVIELEWSPVGDEANLGYQVYRSLSAGGPFQRANQDLLVGTSYFRDAGLALLTRYYYRVSAVDSSLVEGEPSAVLAKSTAPPEKTGFPLPIGIESSSHCAVGDVTGDQQAEIVLAADEIYVWTAEGGELFDGDGNAQTLGPITDLNGDFSKMGVALAELDGAPGLEIIACDRNARLMYVFGSDGTPLTGWPQPTGNSWVWAPPAVGDIDGDGEPEIVCNNLALMTLAWHADGSEVRDGDGNPATNGPLIDRTSELSWAGWNRSGPALCDLDHDGAKDIIFGTRYGWETTNSLRAYRWDGTQLPGFPVVTGGGGSIMVCPTVADLDVDGIREIIFVSEDDQLHVVHEDGSYYVGFPRYLRSQSMNGDVTCPSPAVGDFDGDGELEIVVVEVFDPLTSDVHLVDTDVAGGTSGQTMTGWPRRVQGNSESSPVAGDIDGDGLLDIVFGIGGGDTEAPNNLYAFTRDGQDVAGFPMTLGGPVRSAAVICDLEGDHDVDIVYGGGDLQIHVWDMPATYEVAGIPWPTLCGNNLRDGVYREPPAVDAVVLGNTSLPHTDAFVKDGDAVTLTAQVRGAFELGGIVADLSSLGGGAAAPPETSDGGVHSWTLASVTCDPPDGVLQVAVAATDELGRAAAGAGAVIADNTAPDPLAGLAALPGHNRVDLSWQDPRGNDANYRGVVIRYERWHGYPAYPPQDEPAYPSDHLAGAGEAFRGAGEITGAPHETGDEERDVYYYAGFVFDEALNHGPADGGGGSRARATSYRLGDVHDTVAPGQYDGEIGIADINVLSLTYGCATGEPGFDPECDIGPTYDYLRTGIPVPDGAVQFMDLMVFAMNFGEAPKTLIRPPGTPEPRLAWESTAPGTWRLRLLEPCADLKGVRLRASASPAGAVSVRAGDLITGQAQPVFLANAAPEGLDVAFAVLGTGCGVVGAGVLFEAATAPGIVLADPVIEARGIDNRPHEMPPDPGDEAPPRALFLWQNQPNPFNPVTTLRYAVPVAGRVIMAIYALDGRRVRTLVDDWRPPGRYEATWHGRDDGGRSLASGTYLCRLRACGDQTMCKLTLLR